MIVQEAAARFITSVQASGRSPHTARTYRWDLEHFVGAFPHSTDVKDIQTDDVFTFIKHYQDSGKSPATVNRMKSCLTSFFSYLLDAGHVARTPFRRLHHAKVPRRPPRALSMLDLEALYTATSVRKDLYLLLRLYLGKGLRLSEALALNVSDVEGQTTLRVVGKRGKARLLNITEDLRAAADDWLKAREKILAKVTRRTGSRRRTPVDRLALFLTPRGWRLSPRGAEYLFTERFKAAGLRWLTIHKLRHAFAKRLLDLNVNLRTIQETLGHEDISTTQIYTAVTRDDIKTALSREAAASARQINPQKSK